MTQYLRPSADISTGNWTASPLYQKIDESSYNDSDYIRCPENKTNNSCETSLTNGTDPSVSNNHIVRYRYRWSGIFGSHDIDIKLMQGTTVIASWSHANIPSSWTQANQTLTSGEANAITDYTDLRLRFIATTGFMAQVHVSWAEMEIPDAAAGSDDEGAELLLPGHGRFIYQ